jgi:flavin reductase (DIM6/NTAB) family NADH-FMN oxidoreductase RutF
MTEAESLAAALGKVPSGIFILTARLGDRETAMLASWVQQCSFDPPQVSVAVRRDRFVHDLLPDGAAFVLNIVPAHATEFLKHFGKGFEAGEPAFQGWVTEHSAGGPAVLTAALGHLDCRVAGRFDAGDHELVIGRVTAGRIHGDPEIKPMVHVRKSGLRY